MTATATAPTPTSSVITSDALLAHWQGHRRLTRRLIELYPDDQLFTFSVGGMRPFGAMAVELLRMGAPTARGVATTEWMSFENTDATSKEEILRQWDASTEEIDRFVPTIPLDRFGESMKAFGQWEMKVTDLILYCIDNEIHHRAQGYVYLRALGVEPPAFWERG